jgi:hypothetical protein
MDPNMELGWISNSNHTATADDWIQVPDSGCIVKKAFFCKQAEMLGFWA